jgi:serine/threonine protein kinase
MQGNFGSNSDPQVDGDLVRQMFDRISSRPRGQWDDLLDQALADGTPRAVVDEVRSCLSMISAAESSTFGALRKPMAAEGSRGDGASFGPPGTGADAPSRVHFENPEDVSSHPLRSMVESLASFGPESMIDNFKIVRQIARGGFGTVYQAQQVRPVKREVALKVLDIGRATDMAVRSFEVERQALAGLRHPGIAQFLDGGVTTRGQHWLAVELVGQGSGDEFKPGLSITRYCDEHQLNITDRLRLFVLTARALQHAHDRAVIHRDIKPGNILVSQREGPDAARGETLQGSVDGAMPKIIDFGIAKLTAGSGQASSGPGAMTITGQPLGTLAYMSPEQAGGQRTLTVQTDVYSMGVLLFELLTGLTPFDHSELEISESLHKLMNAPRPKPSERLLSHLTGTGLAEAQSIGADRKTTTAELLRILERDLDWLVLKAISKRPDERYSSMHEFFDDVQRYLDGFAPSAAPVSKVDQARRFVLRNRPAVLGAVAVGAALLSALTAGLGLILTSRSQAELAQSWIAATQVQNRALLGITEPDKQIETLRSELRNLQGSQELDGAWTLHPRTLAARQALIGRLMPKPAAPGEAAGDLASLPLNVRSELAGLIEAQTRAIEQHFGSSSPLLEPLRQTLDALQKLVPAARSTGSTASVLPAGSTAP